MMIKQRIVRAAMGIALITASSMAAAETTAGWYFGANLGQAQVDINRANFDSAVASAFVDNGFAIISATSSLDDSDTSWSAIAGYSFSPYFSIEGSYLDLGTAKYRASGRVNPPGPVTSAPASFATDFDVSGFTAAAVGTVPIGQMLEAHGRVGLMFADIDVSGAMSVSGFVPGAESFSSDSRDVFFGLGAGLHFGGQWSISLDWQTFKDVGDEEETGEADIDRISLGVTYRL
jgi:OOP family OmpA-OmpF porin